MDVERIQTRVRSEYLCDRLTCSSLFDSRVTDNKLFSSLRRNDRLEKAFDSQIRNDHQGRAHAYTKKTHGKPRVREALDMPSHARDEKAEQIRQTALVNRKGRRKAEKGKWEK